MKDPKGISSGPENPQRRTFLIALIAGMGGFIGFILGGSGLYYFLSPALRGKKKEWVDLGPLHNFKEGQPVKADYLQRKRDGWEVIDSSGVVWVLKEKENYVVFDSHCSHLGCPYNWDSAKEQFVCPCHGGIFGKDGRVVAGPPPRPLDRIPVKTENGSLFIMLEEKA